VILTEQVEQQTSQNGTEARFSCSTFQNHAFICPLTCVIAIRTQSAVRGMPVICVVMVAVQVITGHTWT